MSFGNWLHTKLHGELVGEDAYGNVYYKSKRMRSGGRQERWVIYKGEPDASKVPAEWHAWLHHTTDAPIEAPTREWMKPHVANMTGTAAIIETDGVFGSKYIEMVPGGTEAMLKSGARMSYTQDSVIIEDLIALIVQRAQAARAAVPETSEQPK